MDISNNIIATPAVRVSNGCKNYGKSTVLQGLNMKVERGVTYALLGSSGCGKTTLLSALVGLKKLGSGSVQIFGQVAAKVDKTLIGYMPQESGLHAELTVSEELHFFGRLYGMEWSLVEERLRFFIKLLQLPGKNCVIQNLSGGETRRVSLAVSLLHKPRLLILDEATVGVDPLLRHGIWEHLYELVEKDGTTIIVSTHYVEEARQADIVSVMRNGRLLVEENPQKLLSKFGSNLLEDIVVELCRSQEMNAFPINHDFSNLSQSSKIQKSPNVVEISYERRSSQDNYLQIASHKSSKHGTGKGSTIIRHLQTIYAMIILNAITLIRHPLICYLLLIFPAFDCMLAYIVYKPVPHPNIGVVNLEQPNCFNLPPEHHKLGCDLVTFLVQDDKLELEPFSSELSALSAVHQGDADGYFLIPRNFSHDTAKRLAFGRFTDSETLNGTFIPVRLDITHYIKNLFALDGLANGFKSFMEAKVKSTISQNYTGDKGFNGHNLLSPFKINEKMQSSLPVEVNYYDQAAVMVLPLVSMVMPSIVGISIVCDKKRGVFSRTVIGGGGLPHLMIASIFVFGCIYVSQMGLIGIAIKILGIPCKGSHLHVLFLCYGESLIGLFLGIFLGFVLNQELEVILMIMGFFLTVLSSQGAITSIETLNYWVRIYVISLPTKLPSLALDAIMFRGWSIFNPAFWSAFVVQGVWIASSFCLTVLSYWTLNI